VTRPAKHLTGVSFFFLCLLPFVFGAMAGSGGAQKSNHAAHEEKLWATRIPGFEVHDQTLLGALWRLARGPVPFGFGFEKVLKNRLSDPDIPDPRLNLRLQNESIGKILDALCRADSRYTWSSDGVMANLFPKAVVEDSGYLLNRRLETLDLRNVTDVQYGLLAITRQLPPPFEQVAIAQVGGSDPYPTEPWTTDFRNLTVRQAVNRIAAHGGPCGTWIFGGARDFRSFGFFNTHRCSEPRPEPAQR
jgi:hypothetical protein